jgi:hypothetical protein
MGTLVKKTMCFSCPIPLVKTNILLVNVNQVEPFKKSWFFIVFGFGKKDLFYEIFVVKKKETRKDKKAREFEALLEFLVFKICKSSQKYLI